MMTSSRPRDEVGESFSTRRGHTSQLSISDPSHHVTEAIGKLYGDDDSESDSGRPMSFIDTSYQEHYGSSQHDDSLAPDPRNNLTRSYSDQPQHYSSSNGEPPPVKKSQTLPLKIPSQRSHSYERGPKSPLSPTLSLRDVQADSAGSQFPLTNIDNPNDIAQELSNLQALRRLSMDVGNNKDPDMPPMSLMVMPTIAPTGDDDENDPSRLLWVPARVHPELAPGEFKSFLENRVHSIRRRSGDSFLSPDADLGRSDSSSSLRRKKSMLSRQIDNSGGRGAVGYVDGAERLDKQLSQSSQHSPELSIDELVKDPSKVMQKLTQESSGQLVGSEGNADDMPILPMAPGMGLRRSTRTTYRKGGSLRSGERAPFSKRMAQRNQDTDPTEPDLPPVEAPKGHTLARVHSEPISELASQSSPSVRRQNNFSQELSDTLNSIDQTGEGSVDASPASHLEFNQEQLPIRSSSSHHQLSTAPTIELSTTQEATEDPTELSFPKRTSSQAAISQTIVQPIPEGDNSQDEPASPTTRRSDSHAVVNHPPPPQAQYTSRSSYPPQGQSLSDSLSENPSNVPGSGGARTDALTFIPTYNQDDRKTDEKAKKDRDDDAASASTTKSSGSAWKWFKSGSDERARKKEEGKRSKAKALVEKVQDNARLDVIQTSIDKTASKGRDSVVLDRDSADNKLADERKKEGHRKSESKKEKDGSIFSSIFGGSKKKEEKEKHSKKNQHLKIPEEPAYKPLVPDVDYHWSRFPLLEERAIYRMAHIKLANPRRPLISQVLLSNFMYSYLAIVQAMHPQINVPTSPQQKRLEEEARRKQQEEEYLAQQQMQEGQDQDALDNYNFEYHRAAVQYAEAGDNDQVDYVDDAQIYEDEHGNQRHNDYGYEGSESYGEGTKEYYQYNEQGGDRRQNDGRDDMW